MRTFMYFHSKPKHPNRTTVCGVYNPEPGIMTFGAARTSDKDRFDKEKGRETAKDVALLMPIYTINVGRIEDHKVLRMGFLRRAKAIAEIAQKDKNYKENLRAL